MSTNNKWQALSMKDRAFLIREAVRNGITDIDSIRDTWEHRFDGTRDTIIDGGTIPSVVVTPDSRYTKFVNSLPDNQRDTPESKYYTHLGWRLYGKPKNFEEAKQRGLYQWDDSDQSYHGVSVGWDDKADIGYFLKPKHHETVKYELDWYNKGLETLEGGEQRPLTGKDREFWQDFKSKYKLDESGSDYKYIPRQHTFDGESNQPTEEKPWYKKLATALSEGARMARDARIGAIGAEPIRQLYWEGKTEEAQELAEQYAKANIAGITMAVGAANPYGIIGDFGITTASTLADTAVEGNAENLGKDLGTNLAFDLAGGVLQWLPKAIKGGKQVAKNIKSLREDFVVKPSVPKVKAMLGLSPKWYNFPNGYEFHFATATPKKYMGELFYAPALEKAATKTAEISKTPLIDAIKERKIPQYETTYIQLDGKTLNDIMDEPISLYVSASPTKVGGYNEVKRSNVDMTSSLPSHTSSVHEIKHAVQRNTNAGKADITEYALGDYRRFPRHEALKSGYHKILADQADFLKELDTGLPADSADTVTELVFQTNASRNIQELNATVAESLYKMFKNRLPYHDERFMTKEMLDLYKTEIAQMTSEEFMKEFSRDANAYARDYIRGIEEIKKKDPARAEYLIKRLKDLVINQYF